MEKAWGVLRRNGTLVGESARIQLGSTETTGAEEVLAPVIRMVAWEGLAESSDHGETHDARKTFNRIGTPLCLWREIWKLPFWALNSSHIKLAHKEQTSNTVGKICFRRGWSEGGASS
jgi:hypothetical protein